MKSRVYAAVAAAALSALSGCGVKDPSPFDPRAWTQVNRDAALTQRPQPMRPRPTTLSSEFLPTNESTTQPYVPTTGPALSLDPERRMSLAEVVHSAVENSLDIRVAGYGPAIEGTRVVEAEARFDPTFFANASYEKRNNQTAGSTTFDPTSFQNVNTDYDQADITTGQFGLRQNLESGGQVEIRHQLTQNDLDPVRFNFNPHYESDLVLQITQPLLRDAGTEVNRARIVINRNNQRISLLQFRQQVEETLSDIESNYWQLVAAEQNVRILERLLDRSVGTAELLFARTDQDVTRVELSQANAEVERNRADLIRARADVRNFSDRLKQLMSDPSLPIAGNTLILPSDAPVIEPLVFTLDESLEAAFDFRQELAQQQLQISNADVTLRAAKNNLLPSLNVVGSIGAQAVEDSIRSTYDEWFSNTHFSWSIGLQFEVPIGNRAARAIFRRSQLQIMQATLSYRSLEEQVTLDVKLAWREVHRTWDEILARRQARFAATDQLGALQQREDNNEPLTPDFVNRKFDAQRNLAQSEQFELQAVRDYNIAIARLELSKGTLLRYNNVMLEENTLPR